jgi:hypothetical protein
MKDRDRSGHLRDHRRRRPWRCSDSRTTAAFEHLHHSIALRRVQAAELVLHIETGLATEIEQVFRIDVQLARQRIDPDFILQAELLYTLSPRFLKSRGFAEGVICSF